MKIAIVLWQTTVASGINSEILAMEAAAKAMIRGARVKIYLSKPWAKRGFIEFQRTSVRQGDVYADVDGKMSHHPKFAVENARYLNDNFDMVMFINGVPHMTKEYGEFPLFKPFMEAITIHKVMRICDGYADAYRE